jgi:hypothetical protein
MGKTIGDYKVCVECANAFYQVAKSASPEKNIADFLNGMMYPFAVNCAFACELYMKAIMIHGSASDEFDIGHKLDALYNKLSSNEQSSIEALYKAKSTKDLKTLLAEDGNTFVEWRYALEKPVEVCISGLRAFMDSLKEYVDGLK